MTNIFLRKKYVLVIFTLLAIMFHYSCKKVALYAGEDSIILISSNKSYLKTGGDSAVISVTGFSNDGEILHDHTVIEFTSNMGDIIPSQVEMINGHGSVTFSTNDLSGVAEIKARSGNITAEPDPLQILVGSAALETLSITANPSSFDFGGGRSKIRVFAFDLNGNLLENIPVILSSTSGYFERGYGIYKTDKNGVVEDYLNTELSATVTAESGAKKDDVSIEVASEVVNQLPTASFSHSPGSPVKLETVYFNGSLSSDSDGYIVSWEWDFGDGATANGEKVNHQFNWSTPGDKTFTIVLKVKDNKGGAGTYSSSITVKE